MLGFQVFFHYVHKKRQIVLCFNFKDKTVDIIDYKKTKPKDSCLYEFFIDNLVRLHIVVLFYYFSNEAYNDTIFLKIICKPRRVHFWENKLSRNGVMIGEGLPFNSFKKDTYICLEKSTVPNKIITEVFML